MPQFQIGDVVRIAGPDHGRLLPYEYRVRARDRTYSDEFVVVNNTENGDNYVGITLATFANETLFHGGGGLYHNPIIDRTTRSWAIPSDALVLTTRAPRIKPKRDYKRAYINP